MRVKSVAQPAAANRLGEMGYETKLRGVKAVLPGSISTRSQPTRTKTGHNRSRSSAAAINVPNEVFGASRFEAKATARWPINTSSLPLLWAGTYSQARPSDQRLIVT